MNKDFYTYYSSELLPELQQLEKKRKKIKLSFILTLVIGFSIYVGCILAFDYWGNAIPMSLLVLMFLYLMFGWIFVPYYAIYVRFQENRDLKKWYKHKIMFRLLNFMYNDNYEYIPRQKLSYNVLNKSGLMLYSDFKNSATIMGEDYLKCVFGNTVVQFSELNAYKFHLFKKTVSFRGLFISASFNKNLNSRTIVLSKSNTSYLTRLRLVIKESFNKGYLIQLENRDFNKNFLVYAEDEVEARYVLSSSFMEKLLEYKDKINQDVAFSFINNRMYAAIYTNKNHFEANLSKPLTSMEEMIKHYTHFKMITDIVKDLELQLRLWNP